MTQTIEAKINKGGEMKNGKIEYRQIAVWLTKHVGDDDREVGVDVALEAIKILPTEAKAALKAAFMFALKAPHQEREDLFQELFLKLWEAKVALQGANTGAEKLAYAIARCDWKNWWRAFKIRQHYSLSEPIKQGDDGQSITYEDLLVGETEFEAKVCGKLDAQLLWAKLPKRIKAIVGKKLLGQKVNNTDRLDLRVFAERNPHLIM